MAPPDASTRTSSGALLLFALGLVLNVIEAALPAHWSTVRIPGALQRIALVFLAVAWLMEDGPWRTQIAGLAWSRAFPINKNLWTSSFALFSAGLAAQMLALFHWLVDVQGWRAWSGPLAAYGPNPLAAYFLSVGFDSIVTRAIVASGGSLKGLNYRTTFAAWLRPCCGAEAASLGYAIAYVVLWGVILGEMSRRRIFIRI